MLAGFQATLTPMLSLFVCIAIGFFVKKKKLLSDNAGMVLSRLETFLFLPALNFNTMLTRCTVDTIRKDYQLMLYSLAVIAVAITLAYLLAEAFGKKDAYLKNIYRYALTFSNYGYMGYAIVPLILGEDMLQKYMLFTLPMNVVLYLWGTTVLIPREGTRKNPLLNLINPSMIAILLGMTCGLLGLGKYVPEFLTSTLSSLGDCLAPIAMLLAGFAVGGFEIRTLLSDVKVYIATGLRLLILPALLVAVLKFLGAENHILYLCLIAYATPFGMNTVVFPAAYGGDVKPGSAMAVISSVLCVLTLPVMYGLLTMLLGG